nr:YigZ family protein [candidate division Zixibacteria bacterium]
MDTTDSFYTIKTVSEIENKIKGSRFIGQAYPCRDEFEAADILGRIKKKYFDATHNCFAWRVGFGHDTKFKYSDDGEPSGTAGRPIYDRIEGNGLTNTMVIVTRYFGGTKLGTGGLTHAYSEAAAATIEKAGVIEKYITGQLTMMIPFPDYNIVERALHQAGAGILESDFSDIVRLTVEIRRSLVEQIRERLIDLTSGRIRIE